MHTTTNSMKNSITDPTTKSPHNRMHSIWTFNERCDQLPVFYLVVAALSALLGYYVILCFPMLFFFGVYKASTLLSFYPITGNLTLTLLWITLSILFAHISFNIVATDFSKMPGLKITPKSAGRLFQLLDEIKAEYPQPTIHQIVITEQYELKLYKLPKFGIPAFNHNTLAIGLPLLLTLSPNQVRCLLTREIIQHSRKRRKITNWLNQLRELWDRYPIVLKQRACIGHQLLYAFFTVYAPLYKAISLPAHIADELRADRNALDLVNSDELLSALQAKTIGQAYFENDFWPDAHRVGAGARPFLRLSQVAKTNLSQSKSEAWLQQQNLNTPHTDHCQPTLQQRMKNLGLTSAKLPPTLTQNAADYFLQDHIAKVISLWDSNWQQRQRDACAIKPTRAQSTLQAPTRAAKPAYHITLKKSGH
jgi:hypothetical protein